MLIRIGVLALVLAACGTADEEGGAAGDDTTTSTSISDTTTTGATDTTTTSEVPVQEDEAVQAAIADLAQRLDIAEGDITVLEVRDVQWPDGALGCPEEGKVYTQAVVDGSQVLLGADDRIYDYHAGSAGDPFLCPSDEKDGGYDFVPPPGFDE